MESQGNAEEALGLMAECFKNRANKIGIDHPYTDFSLEAINQWRKEGL
jgi:hypothetical protein